MKKFFFPILILLVAFISGCNLFDKEDPVSDEPVVETTIDLNYKTTADDGTFSIKFPSKPEFSTEPVETEVAILDNNMYILEYSIDLAYMVAYTDYPQDHIDQYDSYELLDGAMSGFVGEIGMTIDKQDKIDIKGHDGIEFVATGGGYWAHMRDYLVKNRLYQIGILSTSGPVNEADAEAFFDSFKLQ
jgi:hypothetical protein